MHTIATIRNTAQKWSWLTALLSISLGSLLLSLCSQIAIPLPGTPIRLTGQTFAVMLLGATMGPKTAVATVCAYIMQGFVGLPVFMNGTGGIDILWSTRVGYILGFVPQVFITSYFLERKPTASKVRTFAILAASCTAQLSMGVFGLALHVGFASALTMGLMPFIIGEAIKCAGLTAYLKGFRSQT